MDRWREIFRSMQEDAGGALPAEPLEKWEKETAAATDMLEERSCTPEPAPASALQRIFLSLAGTAGGAPQPPGKRGCVRRGRAALPHEDARAPRARARAGCGGCARGAQRDRARPGRGGAAAHIHAAGAQARAQTLDGPACALARGLFLRVDGRGYGAGATSCGSELQRKQRSRNVSWRRHGPQPHARALDLTAAFAPSESVAGVSCSNAVRSPGG